ncbi:DUF2871 domain-containing protein [Microbacterium candidum]|uniref:DUF2871 domain-containing protein n=1 Tax=Microbacterium candidum TaxID=3041922 RepID=A0ABT7MZH4_9MICO|nr:DUF2871 domain-containing protein [Microbacterium sp. ASV49]MDL9979850.1 DUF2871 domain-containing protein [Microbacterium sp. ASV49]
MTTFSQRASVIAASVYLVLGLAGGLMYRELTKSTGFPESSVSQLGVLHTHLLALGFLFFLIVLVVDRVFGLGSDKLFQPFFWIYNAGLLLTAGTMAVHGTLTVLGKESSAAVSGIAGMGHIVVTVALLILMVSLIRIVWKTGRPAKDAAPALERAE